MCNMDLRQKAKEEDVFLWQIAEKLGISEATMTRRLRFELTEQEKQEFIQIINELAHPDDIVEIPENFKKDLYDKFTHRKG